MTAYGIQHVVANTDIIAGVRSQRFDPRLIHSPEGSSGSLHLTAHHFQACAPIFDFESTDLQALATLLSANADAPYVALTDFKWYDALMASAAPGYDTGLNHRQNALTAGALIMPGISWRPGDHVLCRCRALMKSADGTTSPITTSSIALPTQQAWTGGYRVTAATLGGGAVTVGCQGLELTIDNIAENNVPGTCRSLGLPYPTQLALPGAHGPISVGGMIRLQDVALAPASGDLALTCTAVDSGGFLLSDTVVIDINAELDPIRGYGGQAGSPQVVEFAIRGFYDGSNKPISITP